jgi:RimJ/RimL family protein N-acetyltransferase
VPYEFSPARASEFIDECGAGWRRDARHGATFFLTCLPADEIAGVVHLGARGPDVIEVVYGIAPAHRRRGLALRALALRAGAARAGAEQHERVLELRIAAANVPSKRLAEAAAFDFVGHVTSCGYRDRVYRLCPQAGMRRASAQRAATRTR